jgi:polyisoprenoid-binding protein YceI
MKRILLSILTLALSASAMQAQKLYATKKGQLKFNATGGVEAIAAVNNQVDSKMVDKTGQIVFSVLIKGFKFDNQLMEDHFNENYLESTKFPKADFKGFILNAASDFSKDGKHNITAEGTLTIHNVAQKVSVPGTLTITDGKAAVMATFKIKIKDYGITGLYIGDKIAPDAEIVLNCKYD